MGSVWNMIMSYRYQYSSILKENVRSLRKNFTDTERILWQKLRGVQVGGYKFRRQFPIGGYILDFYCIERKLAIELDGSQHSEDQSKIYDLNRTTYLGKQGIKVLRFWNNQVIENMDGVLEVIWRELERTSS